MDQSGDHLEAEERAIRLRLSELKVELDGLQTRLEEIARAREQSPRPHPDTSRQARPPGSPPKKPVDPLDRLHRSAPGTGFFAPDPSLEPPAIAMWVRASPGQTVSFDDRPDVELRAALLKGSDPEVALVPVLVCLGPEAPENLHEAWIDECDEEIGGVLAALATQEELTICLYQADGRPARNFRVPNRLQALAAAAHRQITPMSPWSADTFQEARTTTYRQYSTVLALWRALKS